VRDALRRLAQASNSPLSPARAIAVLNNLRDSSVGPWVRQAVTRYSAQPPEVRRLQAAAAAVVLIALVLVILPGGSEAPSAPAAAPSVAGSGGGASVEAGAPAKPTVIDQVVKAAAQVVEKAAAPVLRSEIPREIAPDVQIMLEGETFRERRSAAQRVLAYRPAERVPAHLRVIAELEGSRGCRTRQDAIAKMKQQGDLRYLPPLQRLSRASRSGCGFLGLSDCYSCIRGDVRDALDSIQRTLPQPTTPPAP
jgi:serine/threonine-protein kinase